MPQLINGNQPPLAKRNEVLRTETEKKLDQLTELWNSVECKILGMQPPRHISHTFSTEESGHGSTYYQLLGLQRYGNKWRLCYGTGDDFEPEEGFSWRPINDCSTEIRVMAANHINALMEEVVRSGKEYLPEIDKAIGKLKDIL